MSDIGRETWTPPADWSAAYDNRAAVGSPAVEAFIAGITAKAAAFRDDLTAAGRAQIDQPYGDRPRQRYDLFLPDAAPTALAVFIHGGYWRTFDKSFWSHLAAGPLAHGAAVAMPSYTLCPEVRIRDITAEMVRFLDKITTDFPLPLHLSGHSAGGHLSASVALDRSLGDRVRKVVSISGVHDLRPLLWASMNEDLHLDMEEAREQSPALREPAPGTDLTCWVGGDELLAFRQQNRLLAEAWGLLGAKTEAIEAAGKNHFTVVEELADPESALVRTLMC